MALKVNYRDPRHLLPHDDLDVSVRAAVEAGVEIDSEDGAKAVEANLRDMGHRIRIALGWDGTVRCWVVGAE